MNDFRRLPDDAKLTAYALGELDGDERIAVERMLENDPKARASVDEIRAMAAELETVFEDEPVAVELPSDRAIDPYGAVARKKSERIPQIIYFFGGLAAAGVAVMLALQEPPVRKPVAKTYYEFEFPPLDLSAGTPPPEDGDTQRQADAPESGFLAAQLYPFSKLPANVDTASYAEVRRFLRSGERPPAHAVRIEAMLNYFPYRYDAPRSEEVGERMAFAASMEVAAAPWAPGHRLVRIGLKGREVATPERGAANLVFLVDVSGSMKAANKLPLVQESMRRMLARLRPDDRLAIVTYADATGLALPSTPAAEAREITAVLDELRSAGSAGGTMDLQLAYDIAKANFVNGGINRVILCTDGDLNVGLADDHGLVRLIEEQAKAGVPLTVVGFGMGDVKGAAMQRLARHGKGNYGTIDSQREAEKLLLHEVSESFVTIAKEVKLQIEFNPEKVASYRLIGYEKRFSQPEEFREDTMNAGEVGAGHTVTALYEIVPTEALTERRADSSMQSDPSKGQGERNASVPSPSPERAMGGDLLTLKVRYKEPTGDVLRRLEFQLVDDGKKFAQAGDDFKFAAGVAGFGMILRDSPHKGSATIAGVRSWAEAGMGDDPGGYRTEFVELLRRAEALQ